MSLVVRSLIHQSRKTDVQLIHSMTTELKIGEGGGDIAYQLSMSDVKDASSAL